MTFLLSEALHRLQSNKVLKIFDQIDWADLDRRMGQLGRSGYGPHGYDPIKMFKALVLEAWHSLSDVDLEEALRVRLDFMVLTELTPVPDATTLCRFRNKLMELDLFEPLFQGLNQPLERLGIKIEKASGAIVDATIITSAARPQKEAEVLVVDGQEDVMRCRVSEEVSLSKDPDARWLKKGKRHYFGYKGFVVTEPEEGFITHVHVRPAHVSEVKRLKAVISNCSLSGRLYADKGYASAQNKALVRGLGLKNGIMEKAQKNHPLTPIQRRFNQLISQKRYRVEQAFGTLKRRFRFERASYITCKKVSGQMFLKSFVFNLLKAANKLARSPIAPKPA